MENKKVVLAYSGGLDTSVAVKYLAEKGFDVIAACMDVGEGKDLKFIHDKALRIGAVESYVIDCKEEFANIFVGAALKGNLFYENKYPLVSALSRPLIAKKLVEIARETGSFAIAHGCTGKGNDQVRFEVAIHALAPELKVIAPVREWHWSREEEIEYAKQHDVPVPADLDNPYSIDMNLWGRAIEAGVLENPWNTCPEDAFFITKPVEEAPDTPDYIELDFEQGLPVTLNSQPLKLYDLVNQVNILAGKHGIGRIDHIENRLVGIKSREFYECPGAVTLLKAHKDLEDLTFVRELAHFKPVIENELSNLIYNGLWFNPATQGLLAYLDETQKVVSGRVKIKLYKGTATCVGRKSAQSLYNEKLATYTAADEFDQAAAVGFIKLWGLPTQLYAQVHEKNTDA